MSFERDETPLAAGMTRLQIVNISPDRALKVTRLDDGVEDLCAVVAPEGGMASATETIEAPIGAEFLVRDDHDGELIQKIMVPPKKVFYDRSDGALGGWFEHDGDRHWKDANGGDWDTLHTVQSGIVLKARSGGGVVTLPIERDAEFRLAGGDSAIVKALEGGTIRIEIMPGQCPIGELRPTYKRLPNADPVLSSYDPRGTFADNIKNGLKQVLFAVLNDNSRNYSIADGDYIVQDGISFNTINTLQGETHSRVLTTTHEYTEALNVGVSLSAGSEEGKVPASGSLSVNYSESRSEARESSAGFTFAWEQTSHYRLSIDLDRLELSLAFKKAVDEAREDRANDVADYVGKVEKLQSELKKFSDMPQRTAEITRQIQALEAQREQAQKAALAGRLGAFIDVWGTHYARDIVFGQAKYETARFSQEDLRKMHETGVQVGLEAKGNIKGVDVGGEVDVGYTRKNEFSTMTRDDRIRKSVIGGGDFDSAEPIRIELRPLGELIAPRHFGAAWRDDLAPFRERLDRAIEALLGEPDLYPVLQGLEIWRVRFKSFAVLPYAKPPRMIFGEIRLNRSKQTLQLQDPQGLDAGPASLTGRSLWKREQPGAAAALPLHEQPEEFSEPVGNLTFYLIAEGPGDNPCLTLNAAVHDAARNNVLITNFGRDLDVEFLRRKSGERPEDKGKFWLSNLEFDADIECVKFEDLPDYKRLEISHALRTRDI